ncbi:WXG100 family type VII secretion target [Microbacterium phyllosphaerae]|uniref:WXG100 family type VII secretion target n=1 Tax=Microbacterium phyllosphaerae TaxID=124798 RepID=UPI003D660216
MIGLKVSTAKGALTEIDGGIDEIERILDALRDETAVLESRWDGEAREAMSVAVRDWHESLERLRLIAREASRVAGQTVERVDAFDRRRAGAWHR